MARQAWDTWPTAKATAGWISGSASNGQPYILEVNPCPDLSSNAGLARMGRAFGWDYDELVIRIVVEAITAPRAPGPRRRSPAGCAGVSDAAVAVAAIRSLRAADRAAGRAHHPKLGTLSRG